MPATIIELRFQDKAPVTIEDVTSIVIGADEFEIHLDVLAKQAAIRVSARTVGETISVSPKSPTSVVVKLDEEPRKRS